MTSGGENNRMRASISSFLVPFGETLSSPVPRTSAFAEFLESYENERYLAGTGRNIRNLPCVSRRTGETGVCMFAFTCAKANGTHLGTCIDRFYFGSCCKIDDEPDIFPQDNSIDDGPLARPFVTTAGSIESNDIPEYFSRPKPIAEKKPPGTLVAGASCSLFYVPSDLTLLFAKVGL